MRDLEEHQTMSRINSGGQHLSERLNVVSAFVHAHGERYNCIPRSRAGFMRGGDDREGERA
jgi:hypothetical protein